MPSLDPKEAREISRLLLLTDDRELTTDEIRQLCGLLQESSAARRFMAELTWQRQELSMQQAKPLNEEALRDFKELVQAHVALSEGKSCDVVPVSASIESKAQASPVTLPVRPSTNSGTRLFLSGILTGALAACLGLFLLLPNRNQLPGQPGPDASREISSPAVYVTSTTACVWGGVDDRGFQVGDAVMAGREIELLEGIAEVRLDNNTGITASTHFRIEGPSSILFRENGIPTLRYGKIIVDNTHSPTQVTVETQVGKVTVDEGSVLGITNYLYKASLHVFRGSVAFAEPVSSEGPVSSHEFTMGQSGFVQLSDKGIAVTTGKANPDLFAASRSLGLETLGSPDRYVESVIDSKPIVYWRFEEHANGTFKNEISDKFSCLASGPVRLAGPTANRSLNISWKDRTMILSTEESFDDAIDDQYSIECWVKPSHYHNGTLVAMVGMADEETPEEERINYALTLELYSIDLTTTTLTHPGRVRFQQRNPPSRTWVGGTNCISSYPYRLRRWQHIVATKDGTEMKLYVNGRLASVAKDSRPLPKGLKLFVGRREPKGTLVRRFIGQLDEIAIYNRALDVKEIKRHFESIEVKPSEPDMI